MGSDRTRILILTEGYLPGCRGGGPIRSISNLVDILGGEFDFMIVTRDRDVGSREPYKGVRVNAWQRIGKAEVIYLSPDNVAMPYLHRLIKATSYDILYLNSYFSPAFTIIPMLLRRAGLIFNRTTIVAPRGEFSPGALQIKALKKRLFIVMARMTGLYRGVVWQASSEYELLDIKAALGRVQVSVTSIPAVIAPDMTNPGLSFWKSDRTDKKPGTLRVVFLSRISRKKNLDGALRALQGLDGDITFTICGPLEDRDYWETCRKTINMLPPNIKVSYQGAINYHQTAEVLSDHDLFFLPTHGENFGHAIIEALVTGCPVLISDQTPWRNLEREGVGWDLPLARPDLFRDVLQKCVAMGNDEFSLLSRKARDYGMRKVIDPDIVHRNRMLFSVETAGA